MANIHGKVQPTKATNLAIDISLVGAHFHQEYGIVNWDHHPRQSLFQIKASQLISKK